LTRCLIASGRRDEAQRAAAAAQTCAEEVQLPMAAAMASCAAAALDLDAGHHAAAAARALGAAAALEGLNDLYDGALARMLAGRALTLAGDRDGAVAEFERVARAFDSFGSIRYRDEAERELRKLGHTTYRRTKRGRIDTSGVAALSGRELQIARLVVERKTNPEIAGELFLSPKTVEAHLRTAFRKMNVTSRVELARAVERADRP
jgi:DNA-binding CsgD family transcriptional regulator